jgi:hypothetical protein
MRYTFVLVLSISFLLASNPSAYASCGTDYWQGNVNTAWEFSLNWSLGFTPIACDAVVIPDPIHTALGTVVANQNLVQGKLYPMDSLQIGINGNGGSLTIDSGAVFQIANDLVLGTTGSLTNNASVQVGGTGYLSFNSSDLTNNGNFLLQNDLYNSGQIALSGGTLTVNKDFYNGGLLIGGALTVNGVLHNTGNLQPKGGITATPQLENGGLLTVGPGGGTMWVGSGTPQTGGYVQYANGILDEVITSPHNFGQIFTSSATLEGTLNIELASGFNPAIGTVYQMINTYGLTGEFATVENQYFNNGAEKWDVVYVINSTFGPNYVNLEAVAAAPEPFSLLLLGTGAVLCYRTSRRRS